MTKWIIVVDDDTANLKMAGHILSKNNMRVTALKSGSAFLEYVNGVADFIRKPFNPDVLLRRIGNIMSNSQEMQSLKSEATIDKLTGLLNRAAAGEELSKMCSENAGCLMMIDLDSFKLVNDI